MLAEFNALWLHWSKAEHLYNDLIENARLNDDQTATVLNCLARAKLHNKKHEKGHALLYRIVDEYPRAPAAQSAHHLLGMSTGDVAEVKRHMIKAYKANRNSSMAVLSLYKAGNACWGMGEFEQAERFMSKLVREYPQSPWARRAERALVHITERKTILHAHDRHTQQSKED